MNTSRTNTMLLLITLPVVYVLCLLPSLIMCLKLLLICFFGHMFSYHFHYLENNNKLPYYHANIYNRIESKRI